MRFFIIFCLGFVGLLGLTSARLEKIFHHDQDRDEQSPGLKKMGRIDFENDDFRRAIQQLRMEYPKYTQYTGYFFIDFIAKLVQNIIVFLVTLLAPAEPPTEPALLN